MYLNNILYLTWTSHSQTGVNKLQISNHLEGESSTPYGAGKLQTNFKLQCPKDQAELGSIELSSMTKSDFGKLSRAVCLEFCVCLLVFVCYLGFVIWCLSDIKQNSISKYFAKNGQNIFTKRLISCKLKI